MCAECLVLMPQAGDTNRFRADVSAWCNSMRNALPSLQELVATQIRTQSKAFQLSTFQLPTLLSLDSTPSSTTEAAQRRFALLYLCMHMSDPTICSCAYGPTATKHQPMFGTPSRATTEYVILVAYNAYANKELSRLPAERVMRAWAATIASSANIPPPPPGRQRLCTWLCTHLSNQSGTSSFDSDKENASSSDSDNETGRVTTKFDD